MSRAKVILLCVASGAIGAALGTTTLGVATAEATPRIRTIQLRQGDFAILPFSNSTRGSTCGASQEALYCFVRGASRELNVIMQRNYVEVNEGPLNKNRYVQLFKRRIR